MRSLRSAFIALAGGALISAGTMGGVAGAGVPAVPVVVTTWTLQSMASPSASTNAFAGYVSCVTGTFCAGVGGQGPDATTTTLGEIWNGGGWSVVPTPNATGSTYDDFRAVSCVTTSFCMAVGEAETAGTFVTLAADWNGSTWALVPSPNPPSSSESDFQGVSCTTVTFCVAVGDGGSDDLPLAEQWNGAAWSIQNVPTPSASTDTQLDGVTCIGTSWCAAVGLQTLSGVAQPLVETWNGSSWIVGAAQPVAGTAFASLDGISCAGPQFCEAVGESDAGTTATTLIETWNGTAWAITPSPNSAVQAVNLLAAVDCTSATSCTAVGRAGPSGTEESPFTERWNGSAWTLVTPPSLTGASGVGLNSVSCIMDLECIAGGFETTSSITQPYAITAPIARSGYRFVASDGGVFAYGAGAPFLGSMGGLHLNAPIVGMAVMPGGDGYYLVAADGGVFNFGSAQFYGSAGSLHLNAPVVGMAVTADGAGYWLVAADGGIFSYGDAQFYGSTGSLKLNKPVVGMAASPNGLGYWLVASDGGIFNYGSAAFFGSMGGQPLNKPIVGMAPALTNGYYLVASDGGIFTFPVGYGIPQFWGSIGGMTLNKPIVGMTVTSAGYYYLAGSDGGIFAFPGGGLPPFLGSTGSMTLNAPIVGIAG